VSGSVALGSGSLYPIKLFVFSQLWLSEAFLSWFCLESGCCFCVAVALFVAAADLWAPWGPGCPELLCPWVEPEDKL
jgi:hypothetical protein